MFWSKMLFTGYLVRYPKSNSRIHLKIDKTLTRSLAFVFRGEKKKSPSAWEKFLDFRAFKKSLLFKAIHTPPPLFSSINTWPPSLNGNLHLNPVPFFYFFIFWVGSYFLSQVLLAKLFVLNTYKMLKLASFLKSLRIWYKCIKTLL